MSKNWPRYLSDFPKNRKSKKRNLKKILFKEFFLNLAFMPYFSAIFTWMAWHTKM